MISPSALRFFRYRPAAWLQVQGDDAGPFLQGQFTQDLAGLPLGRAAYGLWLSQKGRIMADSFILAGPGAGEFQIGSYYCPGPAIAARLEGYIVADDVTVADESEDWEGVAVLGEGARAWIEAAGIPGAAAFPGRRCAGENWECLWPPAGAAIAAERLAARTEVTVEEMERERIAAGIPAVPRDAGPGDLPPEAGLLAAAISYTKGCYLGQEVIARLKSRGRTRRQLRRVAGSGAIPSLPAILGWDGKKIGELRSAVQDDGRDSFVGLAMVAADLPPDAALGISPAAADPAFSAPRVRFCV